MRVDVWAYRSIEVGVVGINERYASHARDDTVPFFGGLRTVWRPRTQKKRVSRRPDSLCHRRRVRAAHHTVALAVSPPHLDVVVVGQIRLAAMECAREEQGRL